MADSHPVHLVYAENVISRSSRGFVQELAFMVRVANYSYHKQVTIYWRGENDAEQATEALYYGGLPDGRELWLARVQCPLTEEQALPGDVECRVVYRVDGQVFDAPPSGAHHHISADSGVTVFRHVPVQHVFHEPELQGGKTMLPIEVAVRDQVAAESVQVHWSTDHWQTQQTARCVRRLNHWYRARNSAARNPNRAGWEMWTARLPIQQAYRVEYRIECRGKDGGVHWDRGYGDAYAARRSTLRVLTLNLHCRQEEEQERKLAVIADAIQNLHIDLVCLQEVAEDWNNGRGDWSTNTAHAINTMLPTPYYVHHDYSHLGFDQYREGLAILSRHEFTATDSRYVSPSTDVYDIHARRVLMAQIHVPYFGPVNVFNAHLSWPDGGFRSQFDTLHDWVEQASAGVNGTVICGDFNIAAGSPSYQHVLSKGQWVDQYLQVRDGQAFEALFAQGRAGEAGSLLAHDGRIDYIWLRRQSQLAFLDGRELFTGSVYDRVSDHTGYYVEFERL
jgi:maltose 6'-phosphate phosphatase